MSRQPQSLADRYRRARESFILANELGCSPAQALDHKRREEADRLWRESGERLRAAMARSSARRASQSAPALVVQPDDTTQPAPRMWWLD